MIKRAREYIRIFLKRKISHFCRFFFITIIFVIIHFKNKYAIHRFYTFSSKQFESYIFHEAEFISIIIILLLY